MKGFSSEMIRPLGAAENHFLEVLLFDFRLERDGQRTTLHVRFDDRAPTVWRNRGKSDVRRRIPNFARKANRYQASLDALLLGGENGKLKFKDPQFPFRYASGGVLPIIRYGGEQYYCLFYRDIFPIGWNIANGGCDARRELLDPIITAERELREELLVIHPKRRCQYVFEAEEGKPLDRPEFADARLLWQKHYPNLDFPGMEELTIPLQWLEGPDRLVVEFGHEKAEVVSGCFLNINALDFGIEVDRVAKINVDKDAILLDGEISGGFLMNEPIGLFQTDKLDERLRRGERDFRPDHLFFDAKKWPGSMLKPVIGRYLRHISKRRSLEERSNYRSCPQVFDLCPVTSRIIHRYISCQPSRLTRLSQRVDVFISFGADDRRFAERLRDLLDRRRIPAFCSSRDLTHPSFPRIIDDALDAASTLIGVATKAENLWRPYVEFEWRSFYTANILLGRKPDARLLSFTHGIKPIELPKPFLLNQQVKFHPSRLSRGFEELLNYLP